ncbi:hypothetical protein [Devosia sp. 66-22]|uniref:hypothetical protein n=1 Tax=Devosia sp. 66-22 TaxID=1895753 RepID=UPI00092AA134|nr:hypothetical protein [Devosia sp. 66-22]OJX53639.1 MAG: hypothetical protein BGO81_13815 [Devosia sp. 66-22]
MALHDVYRVVAGNRLEDGRRIDFEIVGDLGHGPETFTYTWDPDESGWPMADGITAELFSDPAIPIHDFVWTPPSRDQLVQRLRAALKGTRLADYVEREVSTDGAEPVPQEVKDAANYARRVYNAFKDALPNVPQDWADERHWTSA